jgi:hypothetical protein
MLLIDRYIAQFAKKYGFQLVGVPLIGAAIVFVGGILLGLSPSTSNFADSVSFFPPWPLAIVTGAVFCLVRNRRAVSSAAMFAWAVPGTYFLIYIESLRNSSVSADAWQGWHEMFAHSCAGESCFDPILACVPVVFSLSYSATAAILWSLQKLRNSGDRQDAL